MQPCDIATADEEWLIDLCHQAENEGGMIGGEKYGHKIIKINDRIAVKYGGVQASEATTQEFAFNHVDRKIVHVPKVYRFIESQQSANPRGYLFMEYVQGQSLKNLDLEIHRDIPSRVTKILAHLGQIKGPAPIPGPIRGGEPQGYLFGDDGAKTIFSSIEDLNIYMNKRLKYRNDSIDLTPYALVLCHGDICRRNLILESDGSLCLIDWGYSGLYPRFFELATISCVFPYDAAFEKPVIREFEKLLGLTDQEKQDMKLTLCVRGANLRWSL
jgi:aminoglycoside phosphotransferase (APT) family kinase protein